MITHSESAPSGANLEWLVPETDEDCAYLNFLEMIGLLGSNYAGLGGGPFPPESAGPEITAEALRVRRSPISWAQWLVQGVHRELQRPGATLESTYRWLKPRVPVVDRI